MSTETDTPKPAETYDPMAYRGDAQESSPGQQETTRRLGFLGREGAVESKEVNARGTGAPAIYVVGERKTDTGRKVLPAIYVNCNVGHKDFRKFRHLPLHEIPLVRRLHRDAAGDVDIFTTGYAPGLPQVKWLSQSDAHEEYRRLAGSPDPHDPRPALYMLPSRGTEPPKNIFALVYGEGRIGAERLFNAMRDMAIAWMKLVQRQERGYAVTPEDVWEVLDIADPRMLVPTLDIPEMPAIDAMELPRDGAVPTHAPVPPAPPKRAPQATAADPGAAAARAETTTSAEEATFRAFLISEGMDEKLAVRFARECVAAGMNPLADEAWARVLGAKDAKDEKKRASLMKLVDFFLNPGSPH
jgi:hypothetical protein